MNLVNVLGGGPGERGDDVTDIHAHGACLDSGDDAPLLLPTLDGVTGLGKQAQD